MNSLLLEKEPLLIKYRGEREKYLNNPTYSIHTFQLKTSSFFLVTKPHDKIANQTIAHDVFIIIGTHTYSIDVIIRNDRL